jgi:hypothetical protein
MTNSPKTNHLWKFFTAGGFDQVKLETGADLMSLDQLDKKLWVALACPTTGIEFDPKTSALIDTDKDGRIRANELIAAIKWAGSMLKNPDVLIKGGDSLSLSDISDSNPDAKQLLSSSKQILTNLGKPTATAISLADLADAGKIFANTVFNGDGVIIAESASDDDTRKVVGEIADCMGCVPDRSGKPGIDQAKSDAFFSQLAAFDGWTKASENDEAAILPAGAGTAAASAAVRAIKSKVDDYFGRCRLAAFDPRSLAILNRSEQEYASLSTKDLSIHAGEFADFPLAQVAAGKALPLKTGINPAHAAAVGALVSAAIKPLLGDKTDLTEADWSAVQAKIAAFDAWVASKAGAPIEKLGIKRVREILASKTQEKINALIVKDKAVEPEVTNMGNVEKLVRYVRDLYLLSINFVNFKDLYDGGEPAIFQCGTLYLDQRSCTLCLTVEDAGRHASMAGLAGAYLAYCDCVRKGSGEKLSIVAIFSQGDDDNLMVGRNGIFYDRKGRDFDATITKILSNPISLRQAFWSPYKKFVRMIEEQVSKRAAAADGAASEKLQKAAEAAAKADEKVAKMAEKPKIDVGAVAAMGVAFGAIGAFVTALLSGFISLTAYGPLAIIGALVAIILLISLPSMVLAYIKLRKRNLGPILDANGWAVNAKAKVNVPFGTSLTGIATLPPGSQRDTTDRFAEKSSPWPKLIVFALVIYIIYAILNSLGFVYEWSGGRVGVEKKPVASKVETKPSVTDTNIVTAK